MCVQFKHECKYTWPLPFIKKNHTYRKGLGWTRVTPGYSLCGSCIWLLQLISVLQLQEDQGQAFNWEVPQPSLKLWWNLKLCLDWHSQSVNIQDWCSPAVMVLNNGQKCFCTSLWFFLFSLSAWEWCKFTETTNIWPPKLNRAFKQYCAREKRLDENTGRQSDSCSKNAYG